MTEEGILKKMGIELCEICIRIRNVGVSTIRGCLASLSSNPFLVGHLCIIIFLYRSSPFVFSLLISASPVLVCTAFLLGTILSFGQPNLPDTDEEKPDPLPAITHQEAIVVDQSVYKPPSSSYSSRNDEIHSLNAETESKNDDVWEDTIGEFKRNELTEENHYPLILKSNSEKSLSNSFDSETATVNSPNSPHFPDEEDVVSDSGSDGGESSSPDASMVDMMPMLDELHPLLDEDSSNPVHISRVGSDVASEQSLRTSTTSSRDSNDDIIENYGEFVVEHEDDNEDDEGEKEEELKSAIIWTEEDQKNLMDLGSSEIERNQRLENLILRRGRRKNLSMVPELNLIDLEGSDIFPPHVGLISTARKNPFDDSYDSSNIPGSAPSVLLHRQNPFEVPYVPGPGQEKSSEPIEDGFHERFTTFFKRHESFTVGPSVFAPNPKMRSYFVPERAITEEPGFLPFNRQSSGLSEYKTNSVHETESVGSVDDLEEDRRRSEEDVISRAEDVIEEVPSEDQETIIGKEFSEEEADVTQEPQVISEMNHVADHIDHGSQSSSEDEEEESLESGYMNITSISSDNIPHVGPIYDSSPPTFRKNLSSSSCSSSEVHAESHTSLPPVLVKRMVYFAERDSENMVIEKEVIAGDTGEKCSPNSYGEDYQEAKERLMTTPSGGGSTSMFYNIAMHEPNFENVEEVPVPNTPVESNETMRIIQHLNIPKIYELNHNTSSPTRGSPLCPDFSSMPSRASSHIDMETIQEESEDIKEIDEGLSTDLDSAGDFSVTRSGSSSIELEKYVVDSIGETIPTGDVNEVNHVIDSSGEASSRGDIIEAKGTDHHTILANRRDEIDLSNHDYLNNISGRNNVDTQSVENVDYVGPAHHKSIVDDESLIREAALNCNRGNSTETSELRVGETVPSGSSSLLPEKEFQIYSDDGSVEVDVKTHEDLGSSSSAKERDDTSESSSFI